MCVDSLHHVPLEVTVTPTQLIFFQEDFLATHQEQIRKNQILRIFCFLIRVTFSFILGSSVFCFSKTNQHVCHMRLCYRSNGHIGFYFTSSCICHHTKEMTGAQILLLLLLKLFTWLYICITTPLQLNILVFQMCEKFFSVFISIG